MKKYLFLAILACLTILSGCKKNTEESVNHNLLLETYDGLQKIVGANYKLVDATLQAEGWEFAKSETGFDVAYRKTEGNLARVIHVNFMFNNTDTLVSNVECAVVYKSGDGCMCADDMKALLQHIGEKPTINKEELGFEMICYGNELDPLENEEVNYQTAIGLVNEACSYDIMKYIWMGKVNSITVWRGKIEGFRVVYFTIGDFSEPE